ncbi:TetR family transcriptional regulator [Nostoc linckia z18]|jgi:TetR/AcrR family transcriptional regulator, regulator of autoinduction and epiphytic fitness|uniref:TetR family transcriptional regulator n=2 Tax=Nostoc linckia TaxID=92942 RepID=A0A9Q5Z7X9_NOSLI|nr:TetR/AcrR family transcriptional regulator [Nostoc linckia]PHK38855.1 TetR family transcriptional regulator [Nostoc linckia z15]PHK43534.1 TetR family transcriptional regulator [Nostoc linckia z16]PHJ57106.1 TetR family transcriptional regulator [Nostoc linckia z1]PHJ59407.1 TetR family transcriptional regulator [Nostoc linckia z3]PHJ63848.1 TetR family transcriptional regulator [Nostoc linckia z2]
MSKSKSIERDLSPEKTEMILDGAMQEFLENGYAAARIDKIAVAAGVSKATIYRRYPDKESLFTALMQQLACKKELFNSAQIQSAQGDPASLLRSFANRMLEHIADDPQALTFFRIIIGESGRFPELARAFVKNIEKPMLESLTQYLASYPELGLPDAEVTARAFVGTLVHFVLLRDIMQSGDIVPMERDRLLDNLVKLIIR